MQELLQLLANPLFWGVMAGYWLFSAAVGSLETPTMADSKLYRFFFRFLHRLAGNLNRAAIQFKIPGASPEDIAGYPPIAKPLPPPPDAT